MSFALDDASKIKSLEKQVQQLQTKLNLLFPGFERLAVRDPCFICHKPHLATKYLHFVENNEYEFEPPNFFSLQIREQLPNDSPLQGGRYHQVPKDLGCNCNKFYEICHECQRACHVCEQMVCLNHFNETTKTCSPCGNT